MGNTIKNYQKKQRRDQRDVYREVSQFVKEKLTEMYFGNKERNNERFETRRWGTLSRDYLHNQRDRLAGAMGNAKSILLRVP